MKIEVAERTETFRSAVWSAMDTIGTGETFEVPFSQLGYVGNLVHERNKAGKEKFSVVTVPVFQSGTVTGAKTVHVVRKK